MVTASLLVTVHNLTLYPLQPRKLPPCCFPHGGAIMSDGGDGPPILSYCILFMISYIFNGIKEGSRRRLWLFSSAFFRILRTAVRAPFRSNFRRGGGTRSLSSCRR